MTIGEILQKKINQWSPQPGQATLTVEEAGTDWKIDLVTECKESLGCRISELSLQKQSDDPVEVQPWADRIAGTTTGLLEPLALLEIDRGRTALLRSSEPAQQESSVDYYELTLSNKGKAVLRRYHASRDGSHKREQIGFTLTNEALTKLVDDLTA